MLTIALGRMQDGLTKFRGGEHDESRRDFADTLTILSCASRATTSTDFRLLKIVMDILGESIKDLDATSQISEAAWIDDTDDDSKKLVNKSLTFADIVGLDEAKQALFERVVLRFTLEKSLRAKIFCGIRKLSGNGEAELCMPTRGDNMFSHSLWPSWMWENGISSCMSPCKICMPRLVCIDEGDSE